MTYEEKVVERMWKNGHLGKEIAERVGWKKSRVYAYLERHRDRCPARYSKTTQEERDEMLSMLKDGMSVPEIANYIGVSNETVYRKTREYRHGDADEQPQ